MARNADSLVPLRLVLVTFKTRAHLWEMRPPRLTHHTRMAVNALTLDFAHREMTGVIELDRGGALQGWTRSRSEHLLHMAITLVTVRAVLIRRMSQARIFDDLPVAAQTGETLGLAGLTAPHPKVRSVRKTDRLSATRKNRRYRQSDQKEDQHRRGAEMPCDPETHVYWTS